MNVAPGRAWRMASAGLVSAAVLVGCGGGGGSQAAAVFTIGGTVTGLAAGTSLVLANNGGDSITISANSAFAFDRALAAGSNYSVTIGTQPAGQTCVINGGSGTVTTTNVTTISVVCAPTRYTIGGSATGLQPGRSITLLDNGGDAITVSANGSFTFPTGLISGSAYDVTVGVQPTDQDCLVDTGSGAVAAGNVTSVLVQCPFVQPLYSFALRPLDGYGPESGVVFGSDGNLYGATATGGANTVNTLNGLGAGTFFRLTPTGQETVLWNFGTGQDGQDPSGDGVIDSGGNFYGTTIAGGANGAGTVFKITPSGQETVLWNFGSGADGQKPFGNLVLGQDGNLYGTTSEGGANGGGTVFRLTPAGAETVLWDFGGGADGRTPIGRLLQASDGNFYGTTENGGVFGYGAVFKLTPAGAEAVLYSFAFGADGQGPQGLTQGPDGDFYGITIGGGTYNAGTAFKVTAAGVETQLWNFGNGSDGRNPIDALLLGADGNFYGATGNGGTSTIGTVFRLTPTGRESVLWSFKGSDGSTPFSTLMQGPDGAIYGTTYRGGTGGGGVVYKLTM